jgi:hypothetical protein
MHDHPKLPPAPTPRFPPAPGRGIRLIVLCTNAVCASLGLASCAEDLTLDSTTAEPGAKIVTETNADGVFTTRVDASAANEWVYFSFSTQAEATPPDPANSPDWDLGFQRFNIITNGGASGTAGAAVAILDGQDFEAVTTAPADGYLEDQPDSDDADMIVDSAFAEGDGWYDYDQSDNTLSPKAIVYVVRLGNGAHYKLHLLDYYDDTGTSAHPSFTWAELPVP